MSPLAARSSTKASDYLALSVEVLSYAHVLVPPEGSAEGESGSARDCVVKAGEVLDEVCKQLWYTQRQQHYAEGGDGDVNVWLPVEVNVGGQPFRRGGSCLGFKGP